HGFWLFLPAGAAARRGLAWLELLPGRSCCGCCRQLQLMVLLAGRCLLSRRSPVVADVWSWCCCLELLLIPIGVLLVAGVTVRLLLVVFLRREKRKKKRKEREKGRSGGGR
ncbi:hypothetical protein MTR67_035992, partial [Solanum verrucosum]